MFIWYNHMLFCVPKSTSYLMIFRAFGTTTVSVQGLCFLDFFTVYLHSIVIKSVWGTVSGLLKTGIPMCMFEDLSIMYHALWDRRDKGATRISQCMRRVTVSALTFPSGPWVHCNLSRIHCNDSNPQFYINSFHWIRQVIPANWGPCLIPHGQSYNDQTRSSFWVCAQLMRGDVTM